jgi:hypothetical protein
MTIGSIQHEIWISRPDGTRIDTIDTAERFDYTRVLNDAGAFNLLLHGDYDTSFLQDGYRIEFWYQAEGGTQRLDFLGFIHRVEYNQNQDGLKSIVISGSDGIGLLRRRIIAYDSGTSEARKSGAADDVMKEIVRENFGTDAGTREIDSAYFSVMPDISLGPTISKSFSYRNILDTLREIGADAFENGTPVYFDIVRLTQSIVQFQTFINQRGNDQRIGSGSGLVFSVDRGNLRSPSYSIDYGGEVNVAFVGGQGQGDDRQVVTRDDASRYNRNIWARREAFGDQRNVNATDSLNSTGDAILREGKPRKRFIGELVSIGNSIYGRDWFFGDRVTAEAFGITFDGIIRAIHVTREASGYVMIDARIEVEE